MRTNVQSSARMHLFFSDVVTKDEADFRDAANLVGLGTDAAKGSARCIAAGMSPGNVAAEEEPAVLERGRRGDRSAIAPWAEEQVDCMVGDAPRSRNVFHATWKREAVFKRVAYQQRPAVC